jgi:outer membrane protein OmpA-like peptidoglycan-associated protein
MSRLRSILAAVLTVAAVPASAQSPARGVADQQQLLERLVRDLQCQPGQKCDPQTTSRTRSLSGVMQQPANPSSESVRRNLELDAKTRALPSTDVEVYFPYNSAELLPETRRTLDTMAKALKERQLAASSFAVVGHTDARGGDTFNQELSERRAKAVRDYLAGSGGVDVKRLAAWGRGKAEPKDANDPLAAVNRRVQLINTGSSAAATPAPPAPSPATSSATSSAPSRPATAQPAAGKEECRQFSPVANATVECERN